MCGVGYFFVVIPLTHHKTAVLQNLRWLAYIFPPPQAGERYEVLNYPFVYNIFSWCAKGIVIYFFDMIRHRETVHIFASYEN